ncbi:phage baseplate assembly protein V [Escherichia coli]
MRTIEAMQRQLLGLIGRAVVKSISAATKCQTVDVSLIAGEPKAGVEHLEPYGFTARANSGAEAVVLFPDGDRSHAVVVTVSDRRYRLKGLQTGEVAVYDDQGQSVTLTREGIVVDGAGKTITFRNAPEARFEMDLEVTGQVKDLCDSSGTTMSAMRLAYNGHRHRENGQGSNTDKPDKAWRHDGTVADGER